MKLNWLIMMTIVFLGGCGQTESVSTTSDDSVPRNLPLILDDQVNMGYGSRVDTDIYLYAEPIFASRLHVYLHGSQCAAIPQEVRIGVGSPRMLKLRYVGGGYFDSGLYDETFVFDYLQLSLGQLLVGRGSCKLEVRLLEPQPDGRNTGGIYPGRIRPVGRISGTPID